MTTDHNNTQDVAAPPEQFNFAQFLLESNVQRADRPAFIDDQGTLNYGDLSKRVRSMATALRSLGLRRKNACCCSCTIATIGRSAF